MKHLPFTFCLFFIMLTVSASGYIGPGGGLSAVGAFLALLAAILLALVGFVWYPIKRLLSALKKKKDNPTGPSNP
ncbi:MAG: hypothetical protein HYZ16_11585 [Bacteroidetes bacterium]|nr:hypothetical protein [Bacteroidota bacterium]